MKSEIEFESVQETANRLGVTVRAVQKWAANERIPGAKKIGRTWFIPKGANVLDSVQVQSSKEELKVGTAVTSSVHQTGSFRTPMPLLNSAFPVGKSLEYIKSIPDEDDRKIALGEYYYFSGRAEKAAETVEEYLDSNDFSLRYSASLVFTFANLACGHIHLARFALNVVKEGLYSELQSDDPHIYAIGIFTATTASVLLHLPVLETPPLEDYLRYLPNGLRLWSCYILAHKAYLEKDYSRSLGIADTALSLCVETYPIAEIYVHLVAVMDLMSLKRTDEAKNRFITAWKLAQPDDFIEAFGEHHGLLQGMIEIFFKKNYPEDFERIIAITYSFSAGWRKIHNPDTQEEVADNLSTTEFTIAMLYSRGWSVKEIANHMGYTTHTVRSHIKLIYMKLDITDRTSLGRYMLR